MKVMTSHCRSYVFFFSNVGLNLQSRSYDILYLKKKSQVLPQGTRTLNNMQSFGSITVHVCILRPFW